ncbi:MAG: helix-turn-helix transcriptional regulator [Deltaproteobacteria bacterium]|nr:helix-turn-helix transcriptional regulator [Deltaproteobacteria bacterium]
MDSDVRKIDGIELRFGEVLRQLRLERGLSQEGLGFQSGYHRTYISLLERGQKSPSLQTIFRLAGALSVAPDEIIRAMQPQETPKIPQSDKD